MVSSPRSFLSARVAASGFLATADASARESNASAGEHKRTFVLVYGSWAFSGMWERVAHRLVAAGHTVIARDLPGLGLNALFPQSYFNRPLDMTTFSTEVSPVAGVTLEDNVDSIAGGLKDALLGGSGPVILVGHSSGGISLTAIAEKFPEYVSDLVYLSAVMTDNGVLPITDVVSSYNNSSKAFAAIGFGDATTIGASRIDFNSSDPSYLANVQFYLASDVSSDAFRAFINDCTPDDPVQKYLIPTVKTVQRWGSIRRSYIRTAKDEAFLPTLQEYWIAKADAFAPSNKTNVYHLDSSHLSFISKPDKLSEILLDIALL